MLAACAPQPPPGRSSNPSLVVTTHVAGLDHLWDVAFTPNGAAMVYDERAGRIWAKPFPSGTPRLLGDVASLQTSPSFVVHGEGGLLGLAIDPAFDSNHFIYACYDTASDVRLVRFTTDLNSGSLAIDTPIVTGLPVNQASGRHLGCRPRFRPGTNPPQLFVGTGDSATDGASHRTCSHSAARCSA
jgi:glucose/arabinose dehydrogenase